MSLERGERLTFLLCDKNIVADAHIAGLENSGVTVAYQQYLGRCDVDAHDPGLHLVLQAGANARTAMLKVEGAGRTICSIEVSVPERRLLPQASLTPASNEGTNIFKLTINGDAETDFSEVCSARLSFPDGPGPRLRLSAEPQLNCSKRAVSALVQVDGAQREPARVVIGNVRTSDGLIEGIAHVELPAPPWANAMAENDAKFIDVNGIRTRYFVKGTGAPLILVHGGQPSSPDASAWTWLANFDGLAEQFRVYALDRLAMGYTDNPASNDDYERYYERVVDHLLGFMDAMDLTRAGLVGHSQGTWPVTRIALSHPERVSCLVNVDGSLVGPTDPQGRTQNFYMYQSAFLHPPEGETKESIRRGMGLYSVTGNNLLDIEVDRAYAIAQTDKFKAAAERFTALRMSPAHPRFRMLKEETLAELEAGKLQVPTLVIWGRDDPEGSFETGQGLFDIIARTNRHAAFHVFANSGHASMVEYPDRFNAVVAGFCDAYM